MISPTVKKKNQQQERSRRFRETANYIYTRADQYSDLVKAADKASQRAFWLGIITSIMSVAVEIAWFIYSGGGADVKPFGLDQSVLSLASELSFPLTTWYVIGVFYVGHDFKQVLVRGWIRGTHFVDRLEELKRVINRHEELTGEHIALQYVSDLALEATTWESKTSVSIGEATALLYALVVLATLFVTNCYGIILHVLA